MMHSGIEEISEIKEDKPNIEDIDPVSDRENCNKNNAISSVRIKRRKPGIIYLSSIPPSMNVSKLREYFSNYGQLGRVYLQPIKEKSLKRGKKKQYSEGWIEFKSKRKAKYVHIYLNNQSVGGKKSQPDYDMLWNIKYLPSHLLIRSLRKLKPQDMEEIDSMVFEIENKIKGLLWSKEILFLLKGKLNLRFKWEYLTQRLEYERQVVRKRLGAEVSQVNKETDHYLKVTMISNKRKNTKAGEDSYVFRQKMTEKEIQNEKLFKNDKDKSKQKKLKNEKYKKSIQKKKQKKQEYHLEKSTQDDFATSIFVGSAQ